MSANAPRLPDAETARRVRAVFERAGYDESGLLNATGLRSTSELAAAPRRLLLERTDGGSPLETLVRLFWAGVPAASAGTALEGEGLAVSDWERCGLVRVRDDAIAPLVQIAPCEALLLASDPPARMAREGSEDQVMGFGPSTRTLWSLALREPVASTLDLGAGCGALALLAARHSERATATDLNERALAFARFNAALNGAHNVECLSGEGLQPVAGRRFERVLANPPYLVTPPSPFLYRSGGVEGDGLVRHWIRALPDHLADGGFAQVICHWACVAGQDWRERLAEWCADGGCDCWVLHSHTWDPAEYARAFVPEATGGEPSATRETERAWLDYYARAGIEALGAGIVMLRRANGRPGWFRVSDAPPAMGPCGDAVRSGFAARDFLERTAATSDFMAAHLRISPHVRYAQLCEPSDEGWALVGAELRLTQGLPDSERVHPDLAELLVRCDGTRSVRDLLAGLAPGVAIDLEPLAAELVPVLRALVERGFLLPERRA